MPRGSWRFERCELQSPEQPLDLAGVRRLGEVGRAYPLNAMSVTSPRSARMVFATS
jgi:hypothetical protein